MQILPEETNQRIMHTYTKKFGLEPAKEKQNKTTHIHAHAHTHNSPVLVDQ